MCQKLHDVGKSQNKLTDMTAPEANYPSAWRKKCASSEDKPVLGEHHC